MSVGRGIRPQKGQRDNFTHEPPCLQQSILGVPSLHETISCLCLRQDQTRKFMPIKSTEMSIAGLRKKEKRNQHVNFFSWARYRRAKTFAHALTQCLNKGEKRSTSRHRRWSVVPNESSWDFGPCDRFWTQLAPRCFLLPILPPGTAFRERYVGP